MPTSIIVFVGIKMYTIFKTNRVPLLLLIEENYSLKILILFSDVHFLLDQEDCRCCDINRADINRK